MTGQAQAVVSPASVDEVAAVMRIAFEAAVPVFPLGGNTGLCYGAVPIGDSDKPAGLVIGLGRMAAVREVDAAANVLTVDAGVTLGAVHEAVSAARRQFPLHLGSEGTAQIGGLISTNAGGTGVLRYGPMRDLVAGLEVVLSDGRILRDLGGLRKNNTGYDLKHLFVGAEGTLGLVTGAALRLFPAIAVRAHAWVQVRDPAAALDLLTLLQERCGDAIEAFELLNAAEVDCVLRHIAQTRSPFAATPPWSVMIELGHADMSRDLTSTLEDALAAAMERHLVEDAFVAQSETQARDIWRVRHSVTEAHKLDGFGVVHDTAVRVSAVPAFLEAADAMCAARFPQARILVVAHLGDGNVHYILMFRRDDWERIADPETKILEIEGAVHDIAHALGGTISAEHGIGRKLTSELARLGDPVRLAVMAQVKAALDPKGLMNPGVLIPAAMPIFAADAPSASRTSTTAS